MERIKISNFRSVKDSWDIELGPITFFTGKNNSGKSTVLKALMVLSDYCKSNNHLELNFRGETKNHHKVDSYQNAINWDNFDEGNKDLELCFEKDGFRSTLIFEPIVQPITKSGKIEKGVLKSIVIKYFLSNSSFRLYNLKNDKVEIKVDEGFLKQQKPWNLTTYKNKRALAEDSLEIMKSKLSIEKDEKGIKAFNIIIDKYIRDIDEAIKMASDTDEIPENTIDRILNLKVDSFDYCQIDNLIYSSLKEEVEDDNDYTNQQNNVFSKRALRRITSNVRTLFKFSIVHLSPHRNNQSRLYKIDDLSNDINRLASRYLENPISKDSEAHLFFIKWLRHFDIGDEYEISLVHGDYILVEITDNNKTFNLIEKGFGAGQLFTMLLGIALEIDNKEKDSIIMIEEPEANLHPDFQSQLADMFFEANTQHKIRFIIETHSDNIIRHSQVIGLRNNLFSNEGNSLNPFKVYYFAERGPYEMKYLKSGKFDRSFGSGFYDITSKSTLEIIKHNRQKK